MARTGVIEYLLMSAGFLMLAFEARFEHRAVLVDDWRAWIPIVVAVVMSLVLLVAPVFPRAGATAVLGSLYVVCIGVGLCGLWFHAGRHGVDRARELMQVWILPSAKGASIAGDHPPLLAPGAFVGLGAIGILLLRKRGA